MSVIESRISLKGLKQRFAAATLPTEAQRRGFWKARFVGPLWLRLGGMPSCYLGGLWGWLGGRHDALVPAAAGRHFFGGNARWLEDSAHLPFLSEPENFARWVLAQGEAA